jgi:hydroxymethylbilane synthase
LAKTGCDVELVPLVTEGDTRRDPIGEIGQTGVFTKELQRALLDGTIDLAVHSLKDLPTETVPGSALVAVPERDDPFDALISRDDRRLRELASGATIGTGSLRRQAQLLHARPDLTMQSIRGNVDTRLRKLRGGDYDAIVLAVAGLRRLALESEITERLVAEMPAR